MYYSKYNIDFVDENHTVVVNTLSASIVRFETHKFQSLKGGNLEGVFTDNEIDSLISMGIIRKDNNETAEIIEKRKISFQEQEADRFTLTVITTTDCNARCFYCYENGIKKQHMTLETASEVYNYIIQNRRNLPVHINWFGGEPLYNNQVIDYICTRLKNDGIEYTSSMTTNAYLIRDFKDRIIDLWHLKRIQITVDAIGKQYNKIKNYIYKDDIDPFENVIDNIKWLLEKNVYISLRINFNPRRLQDAIDVIQYLHNELGNPKGLHVYCAWISDDNIPTPDKYKPDENPLLTLYAVLMDCGYIKELSELGIRPKLLTCSLYWKNMAVVNADGNLHKCQHGIIDGTTDAFGNVHDGVTNSQNITFWTDLEYPFDECMNCVCLPICQGGCKYRAAKEKRNDVCIPIKYCLTELIKLFYQKLYKRNT